MRYRRSFEAGRNLRSAAIALLFLFGYVIANRAEAQNNVPYQGGRVMVNPVRAYLIYWLPAGVALDTNTQGGIGNFEALTQGFFSDISGSDYFNIVAQYPGKCGGTRCVVQNYVSNPVTLGATWVDTQAYPHAGPQNNAGTQANPLQDSDIQGEVTRAIGQNNWIIDANSIFIVITGVFNSGANLGSGVEECVGANCTFRGVRFCAYHSTFSFNGQTVIYSYLSDASFNTAGCAEGIAAGPSGQVASDREVALMTHEFFESVTDPDLQSWINQSNGPEKGNEIGDKCNQIPATVILNGNTYAVQQEWSNASSSCVASFPPPGTGDCSSPENYFYVSPGNNPMQVTQGGVSVVNLIMTGPWVAADLGNNATGNVFSNNLPPGSTTSTYPGSKDSLGHCEGLMGFSVLVPFSARPGSYSAKVRATDMVSGVTAQANVPIQILACVPATSCPPNLGLCGSIANGCGGTVDCGACGAGLSCSNSHCCAAGDVYDASLNVCEPESCPPGTSYCYDLGQCTTDANCQPKPSCHRVHGVLQCQ
jgi:hypothetical protein